MLLSYFPRVLCPIHDSNHWLAWDDCESPPDDGAAMCQVKYMERSFQREGLLVNPHVDLRETFDDAWEPSPPWGALVGLQLEDDRTEEEAPPEVRSLNSPAWMVPSTS